ncbi:hypothetical protein A5724_27550 [Mycobacterium sp. ACS1612]|uniref:DUF7159 family protein n=1 Tax=Mycobacterium sp. ACS1612 TaxID=1834117 RepID=UPI000801C471|nr:hypothetical protein [Mycobacterium sp. ACS1612]OBF28187.1 hypothetical protein A5724_27550 [Mycobacterium sp. ACS1612]
MDIVLGVSMTPTTVRMVLVEGEKADGAIVDHDAFDVAAVDGSATSASAAEQVVEAILGTKESAAAGGHHLKSIGVTWSDHAEASTLRDTLAARGIDDVMLVSDGHAAGALAQAVGRAVGYATTALLFIDRDTATLSVVQTDDGSIVKVLSRSLHSGDAMAVLADMAAAVDAQDSPPQGMFVVGSGVDVSAVKAHLENLVSLPVSAPDDADVALARGAALASAHAPALEASTVGLAYSQDPDGTTAGNAYAALAAAETQMAPLDADARTDLEEVAPDEGRKPFLLVGSALTSIFVIGVVALVISLAVSIRPTVDQRPDPGPNAIAPTKVAPPAAPAPVQEAQQPVAPPAPPPAAETIKPPVPVAVQEAPAPKQAPRQVFVEQAPAPQAPPPAPAPAAPPPAPEAPPPAPPPVAPAPIPYIPPPVYNPPIYNPYLPPPAYYPRPKPPWSPPWQHDEPQDPPDYPQSPGHGGGDYPGSGGGGNYPGTGGGNYPGGGYPGSGGHGGRGPSCFLIFCRG